MGAQSKTSTSLGTACAQGSIAGTGLCLHFTLSRQWKAGRNASTRQRAEARTTSGVCFVIAVQALWIELGLPRRAWNTARFPVVVGASIRVCKQEFVCSARQKSEHELSTGLAFVLSAPMACF